MSAIVRNIVRKYCTQDEKRVANAGRALLGLDGRGRPCPYQPRIYLIGNRGCAILLSAIGWTKLENADAI